MHRDGKTTESNKVTSQAHSYQVIESPHSRKKYMLQIYKQQNRENIIKWAEKLLKVLKFSLRSTPSGCTNFNF